MYLCECANHITLYWLHMSVDAEQDDGFKECDSYKNSSDHINKQWIIAKM